MFNILKMRGRRTASSPLSGTYTTVNGVIRGEFHHKSAPGFLLRGVQRPYPAHDFDAAFVRRRGHLSPGQYRVLILDTNYAELFINSIHLHQSL